MKIYSLLLLAVLLPVFGMAKTIINDVTVPTTGGKQMNNLLTSTAKAALQYGSEYQPESQLLKGCGEGYTSVYVEVNGDSKHPMRKTASGFFCVPSYNFQERFLDSSNLVTATVEIKQSYMALIDYDAFKSLTKPANGMMYYKKKDGLWLPITEDMLCGGKP